MSGGARELLKWIALVCMTCDHVAKVIYGGYVPVLSELGRIAFPVFALVMAFNLAQPCADVGKSVRRLAVWGLIAQPVHILAFGSVLPLNVLLTFALAAAAVWSIERRQWVLFALCAFPAPLFVDYQWCGMLLVLGAWTFWRWPGASTGSRAFAFVYVPLLLLCAFNGNLWALAAVPVLMLGDAATARGVALPRTRWAFYGYYVAHLSLLAVWAFAHGG